MLQGRTGQKYSVIVRKLVFRNYGKKGFSKSFAQLDHIFWVNAASSLNDLGLAPWTVHAILLNYRNAYKQTLG